MSQDENNTHPGNKISKGENSMKSTNREFSWSTLFIFLPVALRGFLRVLNRSIFMMPAMLIAILAITFYFAHEQLLSEAIAIWSSATTDERITLVKLILKSAFYLSFAACFVDALISHSHYAIANIDTKKNKRTSVNE